MVGPTHEAAGYLWLTSGQGTSTFFGRSSPLVPEQRFHDPSGSRPKQRDRRRRTVGFFHRIRRALQNIAPSNLLFCILRDEDAFLSAEQKHQGSFQSRGSDLREGRCTRRLDAFEPIQDTDDSAVAFGLRQCRQKGGGQPATESGYGTIAKRHQQIKKNVHRTVEEHLRGWPPPWLPPDPPERNMVKQPSDCGHRFVWSKPVEG